LKSEPERIESRDRIRVERDAPALVEDRIVPLQSEALESAQDTVRATRYGARQVEILDANEPAAALMTRIEKARDRGKQGTEVK
jgi:hypothetical protein